MMDGTAIEKLENIISGSITREVNGITFSAQKMEPLVFEPKVRPIEVRTLTGFVDYIQQNSDYLDKTGLMIQVVNHSLVCLMGEPVGLKRERNTFITAVLDPGLERFPFGEWLDAESFTIKLQVMFSENEDSKKLLQFVGRLTVQNTLELADDGISQSANIKIGMSGALKGKGVFGPIVLLRPWRTFRELGQVESLFLFRMREVEGKTPLLTLIEADGGVWRNTAILRIRDWLQERLPEMRIIA